MLTLLITYFFSLSSADVIVNSLSGPIRGKQDVIEGINGFFSIPYAEPPVGKLRFEKPLPRKTWTDVYNATSISPQCPQFPLPRPTYYMPSPEDLNYMSEDCLYLNLWIPQSNRSVASGDQQNPMPIVIFIHGGFLTFGSTKMKIYDGARLAKRGNIIVATINYRLGVFGFFHGNSEQAPGNQGMHDQMLAMKWIKDNAATFEGDPQNIVLMGESAGGFSIAAHMVSPLSKNLFQKAILQSGALLPPYYTDNDKLFKNSQKVASATRCSNRTTTLKNDPQTVIDCMRQISMKDMIEANKKVKPINYIGFYPVIGDDFLPKSQIDLYQHGQFNSATDLLIGLNRDEGTMMISAYLPQYFGHYGHGKATLTTSAVSSISRTALTMLGQSNPMEIVKYYLNTQKNSTDLSTTAAEIFSDYLISCGAAFLADMTSLKGNAVHFYNFAFRSASTPMADWIGVTHMDELQYVFGNPFHDNFTEEEVELSNRLMDRWSAFAKTGNPNIPNELPWLKYTYQTKYYLNFGQEEESIRKDPIRRCEIWRRRFGAEIKQ